MNAKNNKLLTTAGLVLGIGLGGFIDGIVFHQILQIHNMLSNVYFPNTVVNIEVNMFWDGLFHAFTWLMTVIGIALLWQALTTSDAKEGKALIGSMLIGFGVFNVVEGTIDHLVLQIHHVIQRTTALGHYVSDVAFLISGILLILTGLLLIKKRDHSRLKITKPGRD